MKRYLFLCFLIAPSLISLSQSLKFLHKDICEVNHFEITNPTLINYLREEMQNSNFTKDKGVMTMSWEKLVDGKEEFYFWEGLAHTHTYLDNVPCNKIAFLDGSPILIITRDFKEKLIKTDLFCFKKTIFSHFKTQTVDSRSWFGYIKGGGQHLILQGEKVLFAIHDQ